MEAERNPQIAIPMVDVDNRGIPQDSQTRGEEDASLNGNSIPNSAILKSISRTSFASFGFLPVFFP